MRGGDKDDLGRRGDRDRPVAVAGAGERRVRQGEDQAAVSDRMPVHHVAADGHAGDRPPLGVVDELDAQAPRSLVPRHHRLGAGHLGHCDRLLPGQGVPAGQRGQRPRKTGRCLPRKAVTAPRWSSVRPSRCWSSCSAARTSASGSAQRWRGPVSRRRRPASAPRPGGPRGPRPRQPRPRRARRSLPVPSSRASAAVNGSLRRISSLARAAPTARARVADRPESRTEADAGEGGGEFRGVGAQAQVTGERQGHPGARAGAVDRGYDRLGRGCQRGDNRAVVLRRGWRTPRRDRRSARRHARRDPGRRRRPGRCRSGRPPARSRRLPPRGRHPAAPAWRRP